MAQPPPGPGNSLGEKFLGRITLNLRISFFMLKRSPFDSNQIMRRTEDLIEAASNRYRITVQVANRAQRRRFEDFENYEDPKMKPVLRAIIEMSDELTQPEIIGE
jgi:DNA-directed RNA polymerase subunit omega